MSPDATTQLEVATASTAKTLALAGGALACFSGAALGAVVAGNALTKDVQVASNGALVVNDSAVGISTDVTHDSVKKGLTHMVTNVEVYGSRDGGKMTAFKANISSFVAHEGLGTNVSLFRGEQFILDEHHIRTVTANGVELVQDDTLAKEKAAAFMATNPVIDDKVTMTYMGYSQEMPHSRRALSQISTGTTTCVVCEIWPDVLGAVPPWMMQAGAFVYENWDTIVNVIDVLVGFGELVPGPFGAVCAAIDFNIDPSMGNADDIFAAMSGYATSSALFNTIVEFIANYEIIIGIATGLGDIYEQYGAIVNNADPTDPMNASAMEVLAGIIINIIGQSGASYSKLVKQLLKAIIVALKLDIDVDDLVEYITGGDDAEEGSGED